MLQSFLLFLCKNWLCSYTCGVLMPPLSTPQPPDTGDGLWPLLSGGLLPLPAPSGKMGTGTMTHGFWRGGVARTHGRHWNGEGKGFVGSVVWQLLCQDGRVWKWESVISPRGRGGERGSGLQSQGKGCTARNNRAVWAPPCHHTWKRKAITYKGGADKSL